MEKDTDKIIHIIIHFYFVYWISFGRMQIEFSRT
jgi:hypothetical protein